MVATMYLYIVPYMWTTYHPLTFIIYVTYGHYLLVNICFHYFKGVYTSPGWAPKVRKGVCVEGRGRRGEDLQIFAKGGGGEGELFARPTVFVACRMLQSLFIVSWTCGLKDQTLVIINDTGY